MRYAIAFLLGAAAAFPAQAQDTAAAKTKADPRDAKVLEAIAALKASDAKGALAIVDPVIASYERDYPASGRTVVCASDTSEMLMGLAGRAVARKDAVALNDSWCYALWAKGYALIELGRIEEAVAPLTRATMMMPTNAQFLTELGYVHQTLKHWKESNTAYYAAVEAAKRNKDEASRNLSLRHAWFGIGYNDIELGNFDDAEKHMNEALKAAPDDQKVKEELEYIRQRKGKRS